MPNPNALVARVITISAGAKPGAPEAVIIKFEGERSAALPIGRRASVWSEMLESMRRSDLPAYVEIDPETSVIKRVLMPMRLRVVAIEPAADGDVDVRFIESQAGHHLLRGNPDFHDLLNALEAARVAGTAALVTATRDEHEIIDVRE